MTARLIRTLLVILWVSAIALPVCTAGCAAGAGSAPIPAGYNVVWKTQSKGPIESMPLGGGNLGLNVWVEDGDVLFYIGSSDAIDENGALLKLGRVRLRLWPNPLAEGGSFRQEFSPGESCIRISGRDPKAGKADILLWVDVFQPVVHIQIDTSKPTAVQAAWETWRYKDRPIDWRNWKRHATIDRAQSPGSHFIYADQAAHAHGGVLWYHRNRPDKDVRAALIKQQGLADHAEKVPDPTTNLTFGGLLTGDGLKPAGTKTGEYRNIDFKAWKVRSRQPARRHGLRVVMRVEQDGTLDQWREGLLELAAAAAAPDRRKTLDWWRKFWDRSYIRINLKTRDGKGRGWQVGRNYQLFRYMLGCNVSGRFPTKFNGGLCAIQRRSEVSPDFRVWGGAGMYMAQNQRLVYWPLLKSGDFDVMLPQLNFYRDRAELQRIRAKLYWGIDGTPFPEAINAFGLHTGWVYGWWRPKGSEPGMPVRWFRHLWHHHTTALEFAYMMLEYGRFTGKDIREYLPVIDGTVRFYDQYYRKQTKQRTGRELDANGKLVLYPSSALEYAGGTTNPTNAIAGLMAVTDAVAALPEGVLTPERRAYYQAVRRRVPPIPLKTADGKQTLAVAISEEFGGNRMEFPQLYAVFPFDIYGLGKPGLQLARRTWAGAKPGQKFAVCWGQGGIFTARLGLTEQAKDYCFKKFLYRPKTNAPRFPAFWFAPADQPPDHDHGGSAMIGLQEMLMQTSGREIRLLPAWPKEWNADFKLRAPYNTTVEGTVKGGEVLRLKVTPESRRKDVLVPGDS